jgi:exopolysaccharide production protein ExoZ
MSEARRSTTTLYGIQYLRALAATAVLVFHAAERAGEHFAIGAAGVDVFFVVSGFIMIVLSERRPLTPLAFIRDRLLRIAPSYWIVTAIMIAGAVAGLFPNLQLSLPHILGSLFFLPVASPSSGQLWPVLVQGWTLNYEIFFYLIFAVVLLLRPGLRVAALWAILAVVVALGLAPTNQPLLAFYTQPLILEFAAGAALAKLWAHDRLPHSAVGLLLIILAIAGFAVIQVQGLEFSALECGPLAVMLVAGMLSVERHEKLPNLPRLAYLGDASYSIYLWHTLALSVVVKAGLMLAIPTPLVVVGGVVAGTTLGVVAYEWVEKPIQSWIKGRRAPAPSDLLRQPTP